MPATPLSASDGDDGLLVGGSGGGWDLEPNDAALGRSDAGPSRAQLKEEIREVLKEERLREELDKRQWVPGARIRRINARLLGCQCLCAVCKSIRAADPAVASGERPQQVHAPTLARGMLHSLSSWASRCALAILALVLLVVAQARAMPSPHRCTHLQRSWPEQPHSCRTLRSQPPAVGPNG